MTDRRITTDGATLLPCPFCGQAPEFGTFASAFTIHCANEDCDIGVETTAITETATVAQWNRRAPTPTAETVNGEMLAVLKRPVVYVIEEREDTVRLSIGGIEIAAVEFNSAAAGALLQFNAAQQAVIASIEAWGGWSAIRARASAPAGAGPKWRHKKRGSVVTEVARGFAQVAHHPIEEMTAVVIYRHDADGQWWVRNAVEFDDGRFEPILADEGTKS